MEFLVNYKIDLFDFTTLQKTNKTIEATRIVLITETAEHVVVTINCAYF